MLARFTCLQYWLTAEPDVKVHGLKSPAGGGLNGGVSLYGGNVVFPGDAVAGFITLGRDLSVCL